MVNIRRCRRTEVLTRYYKSVLATTNNNKVLKTCVKHNIDERLFFLNIKVKSQIYDNEIIKYLIDEKEIYTF